MIFILVFLLCGAWVRPARGAEKYVFQVPMVEGLSVGGLASAFEAFMQIMSKKTGLQVDCQYYPFIKGSRPGRRILNKMKKGDIHFTYLYANEYLLMKDEVDAVMTPLFTIEMLKKNQTGVCALVRADAPYKSMAGTKGARWGGSETMRSRFLLHNDGVDQTLASFYKNMKYIDDGNIMVPLDELIDDKIDVYVTYALLYYMIANNNPKYKKEVKPLACADYEHNWIFFARNDVPPEVAKQVRATMVGAYKDPDYAKYRFLFKAIQGRFSPFDPKELNVTEKTVKLIKKHGWLEEETAFLKKHIKYE